MQGKITQLKYGGFWQKYFSVHKEKQNHAAHHAHI